MTCYKYLVLRTDSKEDFGGNTHYMDKSFSGSLFTPDAWYITNFHILSEDSYWNSPEDLLLGFSRWYTRVEETQAYNMGNRIYAAVATYKFFRVVDDLDNHGDEMDAANKDLRPFEITEDVFIEDIKNSYAFKSVGALFSGESLARSPKLPIEVHIRYNKEYDTWCWVSDYLSEEDYKGTVGGGKYIPVGLSYRAAIKWISDEEDCNYRFGGNDSYYKRKAIELGGE